MIPKVIVEPEQTNNDVLLKIDNNLMHLVNATTSGKAKKV